MSTAIVPKDSKAEQIERVLIGGDISRLSADERVQYYQMLCASVGLNPMTRPFEFITLNGKLTLYAKKDATDQLRAINQISITIVGREVMEDCYIVTARATTPAGRTDESIGAVNIGGLKGEARANAVMKSETKAKRRVTLSISGLGLLDELEVETIPSARPPVSVTTEPIELGSPVVVAAPISKGPESASSNGGERKHEQAAPAAQPDNREPYRVAADLISAVSKTDAQPEIYFEKLKSDVAEKQAKPKVSLSHVEFEGGLSVKQKQEFAIAFEDACHAKMASAEKKRLRGKWLVENGFKDDAGQPTSARIWAKDLAAMTREACNWVRPMKPNEHGLVIDGDDISF